MAIEVEKMKLEGVLLIHSHVANDERGYYRKNFEKDIFIQNGLDFKVTESSDIYSRKGTIRGLHYQILESQAKLLHVIKGVIYDVAVDLRRDSATFGQWSGEILREHDHKSLYIPEGFAHGFLALEDETIFSYQCSGRYIPECCGGIYYNDKILNIQWPLDNIDKVILSEKDAHAMSFKEYCKKYD